MNPDLPVIADLLRQRPVGATGLIGRFYWHKVSHGVHWLRPTNQLGVWESYPTYNSYVDIRNVVPVEKLIEEIKQLKDDPFNRLSEWLGEPSKFGEVKPSVNQWYFVKLPNTDRALWKLRLDKHSRVLVWEGESGETIEAHPDDLYLPLTLLETKLDESIKVSSGTIGRREIFYSKLVKPPVHYKFNDRTWAEFIRCAGLTGTMAYSLRVKAPCTDMIDRYSKYHVHNTNGSILDKERGLAVFKLYTDRITLEYETLHKLLDIFEVNLGFNMRRNKGGSSKWIVSFNPSIDIIHFKSVVL